MRTSPVALVALLAFALVGCGGVDREEFARQAGEACQEADRVEASEPDEAEMTQALEREVERLEEIEPPEEDAERYRELVRLKAETAEGWREFVEARAEQAGKASDELLARVQKTAVDAAQIADDLRISGCDRALS